MWTDFLILISFHPKEMVWEAVFAHYCSRRAAAAIPVVSLRYSIVRMVGLLFHLSIVFSPNKHDPKLRCQHGFSLTDDIIEKRHRSERCRTTIIAYVISSSASLCCWFSRNFVIPKRKILCHPSTVRLFSRNRKIKHRRQ